MHKAIVENILEKVSPQTLTQPLKTMHHGVWPTRNHRFHLSSFALKCLKQNVQVVPISETLVTKVVQRPAQHTSTKSTNKRLQQNTELLLDSINNMTRYCKILQDCHFVSSMRLFAVLYL